MDLSGWTPDSDASRSLSRSDLLPGLGLLAVTVVSFSVYWPQVLDDVYITLRYAENLLTGNGLTFNPGERVEGYTNFLWTLISAGIVGAFGRESALLASKVLSACFGFGVVLLTYRIGVQVLRDRWGAFAAAAILAGTPNFAMNAVSGLETALFGFLLLLACDFKLRSLVNQQGAGPENTTLSVADVGFSLTMALAALTRPEGFYVFTVLMFFQFFWGMTLSRWVGCGLVFSAIAVPYLAWKLFYFGHLLPNTYYAKPGEASLGAMYVVNFLRNSGWTSFFAIPIFVGFLGVFALLRASLRERDRIWVTVFAAVLFSAAVISGGDWMPGYRFIVPALPFVYVILVSGIMFVLSFGSSVHMQRKRLALVVLSAFFLFAFNENGPMLVRRAVLSEVGQREAHQHIGRWLEKNGSADDLVILGDLGEIAYFGRMRAIDYHGLVDPVIARSPGRLHRKTFEPRYLMEMGPRFVVLLGTEPVRSGPGGVEIGGLQFVDQRIFDSEGFSEFEYRFSRHAEFEGYLHVFERRSDSGS